MRKFFTIIELSKYVPNGDILGSQELKLRELGISDVEELTQAKNLRKVDFSKNKLQNLSFLRYCWNITDINVSNNNLSSLDEICNLENVKVLNISNNNIRSIDSLCRSPGLQKSLKVLIANHNNISRIPDFSCFKELETIVLSHNNAQEMDTPRNHCSKLKKVSLSNNCLKQFPFCQNFNLVQELRLNNNKILSIPPEIAYMGQIRILELGHNFISEIDPIFSLKKLKSLNISKNPCISSDDTNRNHSKSEIVDLIRNRIPSLESLNGCFVAKAKSQKKRVNVDKVRNKNKGKGKEVLKK
ncbi:leucine-rich repeat protein [Cryptosporidium felis]|nr:leucine-rich repeat protein [Cryptosporidium felis]